MFRIILAIVLGTVVAFGWGFVSWVVLPWHNATLHRFADEQAVSDAIAPHADREGVYVFPYMPHEQKGPAYDAWVERHKTGPVGTVFYLPTGGDPMPPRMFALGVGIDLITVILLVVLVCLGGAHRRSFAARLGMVVVVGAVIAVATDAMNWNWWRYPADYSLVNAADHLVKFALVGLVLATLVRVKPAAPQPPTPKPRPNNA